MNVEKISRKKISESVVEQIEKMIQAGEFKAGEKLPSVRELCDLFGVGRSSVRDAITTLQGKGTVYVKQGEGTFICKFDSTKLFYHPILLPSARDITELFQVRKILEPGIAEMAALNRSYNDLKLLEESLSKQFISRWEADYHFHQAIAKAAGNEILIQFMQFISTTTQKAMVDFHHYIERNEEAVQKIAKHHDQIYQSITLSESKKAHLQMMEHLQFVEQLLQSSLAESAK
ncbi:FadR family transcriptional regulator [Priestia megaterium]|nr:FadR family transcriptional regulator [Priestia megaterium]